MINQGPKLDLFPKLDYATSPTMADMMKRAGTALGPLAKATGAPSIPQPGQAIPGAVGPTSVGSGSAGPMPLVQPPAAAAIPTGMPGSPAEGPVAPQPGIMDAMKGMMPDSIQNFLRTLAAQSAPGQQPQLPGTSLFSQAQGNPMQGGLY